MVVYYQRNSLTLPCVSLVKTTPAASQRCYGNKWTVQLTFGKLVAEIFIASFILV